MTNSRATRAAELDTEISRTEANVDKHTRKGQAARARLVELKRERHALNLPAEPAASVEVIRFTKKYGGNRAYHFAAIAYRLHGPNCNHKRWSVTGKKDLTGIGWGTLAEFIAADETTVPKVQWLQNSIAQPFAELGFNVEARRAEEAAAFAVQQSGKPYVYGGL
ncbi:hypothetical protein [Nocardia phage KYD2]|nr:hypothetical protein [Nocardia phage KYD2]